MKKNELLSTLRSLQSSKGRTSLAVAVGVLAMLLLLLSELLPGGGTQKAAASTTQTVAVSQYQTRRTFDHFDESLRGANGHAVRYVLETVSPESVPGAGEVLKNIGCFVDLQTVENFRLVDHAFTLPETGHFQGAERFGFIHAGEAVFGFNAHSSSSRPRLSAAW